MRHILVIAALAAVSLHALPPSSATTCYVVTTPHTFFVNGYYVWGTAKEIRKETNGLEGLQQRASGCTDGTLIPEDVCVGGLGLNLDCPFDFLDHIT